MRNVHASRMNYRYCLRTQAIHTHTKLRKCVAIVTYQLALSTGQHSISENEGSLLSRNKYFVLSLEMNFGHPSPSYDIHTCFEVTLRKLFG